MAPESFKYKPQPSIDCCVALGQELGFSELSILSYESGIDFRYQPGMCLNGVLLVPGYTDGDPRRGVLAQGGEKHAQPRLLCLWGGAVQWQSL